MAARAGFRSALVCTVAVVFATLAARGDDAKKPDAAAQVPAAGPARVTIEPRAPKPAPGAEAGSNERRAPNIRVDKTIVQINVTVSTPLGQVVTGMEREHFRLFEHPCR
jgi:hypothetical protein